MNTQIITDLTGPQQQNSNPAHLTSSLGDAFVAASTPVPINPTPVFDDDPQAIERAEEWLYSEHSPDAVGDDRFPTAVAIAIVLREQFGLSEFATQDLVERWNWFGCTPSLDHRDIERAVHLAYSDPTAALELITRPVERTQALQPLQGDLRDALAPLDEGGEVALPASRETLPTGPETAARDTSAVVGPRVVDNAPADDNPPPVEVGRQRRRPLSGAERMRRRRAELRQLGLAGETKGRLKGLKVTPPVTASTEIVTAADTPTAPTAENVTATSEIVTPNVTEAADVR